jgi:hypothetical protein
VLHFQPCVPLCGTALKIFFAVFCTFSSLFTKFETLPICLITAETQWPTPHHGFGMLRGECTTGSTTRTPNMSIRMVQESRRFTTFEMTDQILLISAQASRHRRQTMRKIRRVRIAQSTGQTLRKLGRLRTIRIDTNGRCKSNLFLRHWVLRC